jgi:acetyltransferase-like isoleucine patch superfamily enzyme
MLISLTSFILKLIGKEYQLDKNLPFTFFLDFFWTRLIMLLRGIFFLRKFKVFMGSGVQIKGKRFLSLGQYATLDDYSKIISYSSEGVNCGCRFKLGAYSIISCTSHMSALGKGVQIGDDVGISEFCYLGAAGGISIHNNVIIGQYVSFHSQNHNFQDKDKPIKLQGVTSQGITLGEGVWVGAKVTFLDGADIGANCVVAAGAVVKGTFPPNCVIAGVPAKIIKYIENSKAL